MEKWEGQESDKGVEMNRKNWQERRRLTESCRVNSRSQLLQQSERREDTEKDTPEVWAEGPEGGYFILIPPFLVHAQKA